MKGLQILTDPDFREIKELYKKGEITREEYAQRIQKIKEKYQDV